MSDEATNAGPPAGGSIYWIEEDGSGVCPHCGVPVLYANHAGHRHPQAGVHRPPFAKKGLTQPSQRVEVATCTNCGKHVADWVFFEDIGYQRDALTGLSQPAEEVVRRVGAYPGARVPRVEPEVPADVARDYREAVGVAHISTRAAAALARRGLQAALRSCP